jgi:RimJ/RimL family protein N-acetyltransferase
MSAFLRIATARLVLREFTPADAADVRRLAGAREIAEQTLLPHPYEDGMAAAWIASCRAARASGTEIVFAAERVRDAALVGAIGLALEPHRACAKLGFWIGVPYWGCGYATECVAAVVVFGFESLALERICAPRFRGNAASARVLEKIGLAHEGSRRQHIPERGRIEMVEQHGCLRWEYLARVGQYGYMQEPAFACG